MMMVGLITPTLKAQLANCQTVRLTIHLRVGGWTGVGVIPLLSIWNNLGICVSETMGLGRIRTRNISAALGAVVLVLSHVKQ
jgi:hypothetical protein